MIKGVELRDKLPHRYPMLLLDEVTQLTEENAVGYKCVTINEPCFQGHFPNAPVMPGVLVMESLCQLVWIWADHKPGVRMTNIKKLRFRRPTMPGDRLKLEVELVERDAEGFVMKAVASVEGEVAVTGQLRFVLERDPC